MGHDGISQLVLVKDFLGDVLLGSLLTQVGRLPCKVATKRSRSCS